MNQLEKYTFSLYSDNLWEYEPQAKTDEFITYLMFSYHDKWEYIYKNELQNLGTTFYISQDKNKEYNSNYIQTNDGVKAILNGEDKILTTNTVTTKNLNINKMKSFFTIVLDDLKKEVLIYKGE